MVHDNDKNTLDKRSGHNANRAEYTLAHQREVGAGVGNEFAHDTQVDHQHQKHGFSSIFHALDRRQPAALVGPGPQRSSQASRMGVDLRHQAANFDKVQKRRSSQTEIRVLVPKTPRIYQIHHDLPNEFDLLDGFSGVQFAQRMR